MAVFHKDTFSLVYLPTTLVVGGAVTMYVGFVELLGLKTGGEGGLMMGLGGEGGPITIGI